MSDTSSPSEVYRIQIENPATELTLGRDERGFVGFHVATDLQANQFWPGAGAVADGAMEFCLGEHESGFEGFVARVGSGSGFIGVGGGVFGLSRFEDVARSFTGIHTGLGVLGAVTGLVQSLCYRDENAKLGMIIQGLSTGMSLKGCASAIMDSGMPHSSGTLTIYGDSAVNIGAPMTVSASALGSATLAGGVSASVKGMVSTSVGGGLFASVTALKSASLSASKVQVVGDGVTTIAARHGEVRLEGANVLVGAPSGLVEGEVRARGFTDMKQEATKAVRIAADEVIELGVARKLPLTPAAPTRIRATEESMRLETENSTVMLDDAATLLSSGSVVRANSDGVTIGVLPASIKSATNSAVTAYELAYEAALAAADAGVAAVEASTEAAIGAAAGFAVGSVSASAAVGAAGASSAGAVVGGILGGTAAAAVVGGLGTMAVVNYIKGKAAQEVASKAKELAASARSAARDATLAAETLAIDAGLAVPITPKIDVTNTEIVFSVGTTTLTIGAMGVTISTPAGRFQVDALSSNVAVTAAAQLG